MTIVMPEIYHDSPGTSSSFAHAFYVRARCLFNISDALDREPRTSDRSAWLPLRTEAFGNEFLTSFGDFHSAALTKQSQCFQRGLSFRVQGVELH